MKDAGENICTFCTFSARIVPSVRFRVNIQSDTANTSRSITSLPSTGPENNIAQQNKISGLALSLIFHCFSPFNCCLSVVL